MRHMNDKHLTVNALWGMRCDIGIFFWGGLCLSRYLIYDIFCLYVQETSHDHDASSGGSGGQWYRKDKSSGDKQGASIKP